jgi:lambda family phage minor tail protein L
MTVLSDIQKLEPGALVELWILDALALGASLERFHGYTQVGNIVWAANQYSPWPIAADGFARTGKQQPVPTLSVGNTDGSITALCLMFNDLVGATVTRIRTLGKYLDAANFGGVNPTADPTQSLPPEAWIINRKAAENNKVVQFELRSALDFSNVQLPRRKIVANQCTWIYRSAECSYAGGPVAKIDDTPTSDPTQDACSHRPSGCILRFGARKPLPFGGFVGAGITRTT